ncbi:MAG TPA: isocitrate lyase/phosphoenolpyruvate mutase family protein [Steroidobacteraceae bacterium]
MINQKARAEAFKSLHKPGDPLVLFNAWDAGSAKAVAAAGAKAIATGSWSVAAAHGYPDGEGLPLELAIANLARIVAAVDLPVTIDLEAGYGAGPDAVGESVTRAIQAGAIGFNLEDQVIDGDGLYSIDDQAARIRAARAAADRLSIPAFINARTDVFLKADAPKHDAVLLDAALLRAAAYADAGASGLFVPGLVDAGLIGKLCTASPLPVNVMVLPALPPRVQLAKLGVARISHGPGPYRLAMQFLEKAAREALAPVVR